MVTQRTLLLPAVLSGIALLAGCGPPPRGIEHETINMYADAVVFESSNGGNGNNSDFTGVQATGAPNTVGCGDDPLAWSPAVSNPQGGLQTFEWDDQLVLEFPFYAFVREVRIYENVNPGAIIAVDLERSDEGLPPLAVFESQYGDDPNGTAPCPSSFNIQVESNGGVTADQYNRVAIYIDGDLIGDANGQAGITDDWPQIDAVEIRGDILVDD